MTRRGRYRCLPDSANFTLVHSNIRGLKSKLESLNSVVNNLLRVDCISLNEHGIRGRNIVKIDNFHSFNKNRTNQRMGGVSLSVPTKELDSYMKIKQGEGDDEYLIIRNDKFKPALNIITFYGENEGRTPKEALFERWQRIRLDMKKIEMRNENIIFTSDIHRKLGNDCHGIK